MRKEKGKNQNDDAAGKIESMKPMRGLKWRDQYKSTVFLKLEIKFNFSARGQLFISASRFEASLLEACFSE